MHFNKNFNVFSNKKQKERQVLQICHFYQNLEGQFRLRTLHPMRYYPETTRITLLSTMKWFAEFAQVRLVNYVIPIENLNCFFCPCALTLIRYSPESTGFMMLPLAIKWSEKIEQNRFIRYVTLITNGKYSFSPLTLHLMMYSPQNTRILHSHWQ